MASYPRLLVDLGSGDEAGILEAARNAPATLCVGIDADGAAAREASARASRPDRKGGLPNALFLAADARALPDAFIGRVDELRVVLPWGSLLRDVLSAESRLVRTLTTSLGPGGRLLVIVSVVPTDVAAIGEVAGGGDLRDLARAVSDARLVVAARRALGPDEVLPRSSWAKRLGIPGRCEATLLEARRPTLASPDAGHRTDRHRRVRIG